jgi:hypothetical protein
VADLPGIWCEAPSLVRNEARLGPARGRRCRCLNINLQIKVIKMMKKKNYFLKASIKDFKSKSLTLK